MRIGLLLPKYNSSQFAYEAINSINSYVCNTSKDDFVLFYNTLTNFCRQPLCAAMTPDEMIMFNDGVIICTNFEDLELCVNTLNTSKKVLYLADIEWLRRDYRRTYADNIALLDSVRLIARSQFHKDILENYCDKEVEVLDRLDVPRIAGVRC